MAPSFAQNLHAVIGTWGRPPDVAAKAAAVLAAAALLVCLLGRGRSLLGLSPAPLPRKLFLWIASFTAALLSIVYIGHYLRGGPRIVDATTYFLQGRALSHGDFSWTPMEPSASFRGRFLLYRQAEQVMGGIFPPGYPLLLSLGFAIGAPMVVGPALAAGIVIATYRLTRAIGEEVLLGSGLAREELEARVEPIARSAALVSVVCAALRYHTADTMSHGATALGIAIVLERALRGRAVPAGLALGYVVATRPVSAIAVGLVALVLLTRAPAPDARPSSPAPPAPRHREAVRLLLATLPGVLLFLLAQRSVTGAWLTSSQRMYYALSDGPADCFRYGFGANVGCLHEHGDFVAAHLGRGYGALQVAGTTLRRLKMHVLDVADLEPLALVVLVPLWPRRRTRGIRAPIARGAIAAIAVVGLHVLAYAPFYFDGNYPGGGARLFADVLPVEHALLALGVARFAGAWSGPRPRQADGTVTPGSSRSAFALVAISLAGFATHAAFDHVKLAERDGGRPMFEPDLVSRANLTNGLVFVDTDHGFSLGHDPGVTVKQGVVVARLWHDDRDRMVYDALDHPTTYFYRLDTPPLAPGAPPPPPSAAPALSGALVPFAPPALGDPLRFEAEAEWPALAQRGGFVAPANVSGCSDANRALVLTPVPRTGRAVATISVPVPQTGRYLVTPRVIHFGKVPFTDARGPVLPDGVLRIGQATWEWKDGPKPGCPELPAKEETLTAPSAEVTFEAEGGAVTLDRLLLKRLP